MQELKHYYGFSQVRDNPEKKPPNQGDRICKIWGSEELEAGPLMTFKGKVKHGPTHLFVLQSPVSKHLI